uniref:Uncharacterized protein n=1 Tax=Lepeophtheirus salmonis TaxID=72036 RepID=A0A0K2T9Z1_LEPSM
MSNAEALKALLYCSSNFSVTNWPLIRRLCEMTLGFA